ncbi:MAG: DUF5123 domain-containing protein [Paludibacteraceae bacterium]|nr:DUF5123 domain-containing protein [Paludibacteraceae bacterium]
MKKIFTFIAAMLVAFAASAATININPGTATLRTAIANAAAGDVIVLANGTYTESGNYIVLDKNLTIQADEGAKPVVEVITYVKIQDGAKVKIQGIKFDGTSQGSYSHFFRVMDNAANSLELEDCELCNNANIFIKVEAANHIDSIKINNCYFHDGTNNAIRCYKTGGTTNTCDKLVITNSTFANFAVPDYGCIQIENLGNTITGDIKVVVDHFTFYNIIKPANNTYGVIDVRKSTDNTINNCIFMNPATLPDGKYAHRASQLYCGTVSNCLVYNTPNHRTDDITVNNPVNLDPLFEDAANGDFTLGLGSPAVGAGTDGSDLGDPRWSPVPEYKKIYFKATAGFWNYLTAEEMSATGAYAWKGDVVNAAWPGVRMEAVEDEPFTWSIEIDTRYTNIIFTRINQTGEIQYKGLKTSDLVIPTNSDDMYTITADEFDWSSDQLPSSAGEWGVFTPYVPTIANGYYLIGGMNGWSTANLTSEYKLSVNPANEDEYMINYALEQGNEFKVVKMSHDNATWYPDGVDNNYVVDANHDGNMTIYFRPDGQGGQGWHEGYIYVGVAPYVREDAIAAKWGTICLPWNATLVNAEAFYITNEIVNPLSQNAIVSLSRVPDDGELLAGKTYLIRALADGDITANMYGDKVNQPEYYNNLMGNLAAAPETLLASDVNYDYYILHENAFHHLEESAQATVDQYKGYLRIAKNQNAPSIIRIIENATDIQNVEGNETAVKFIENGKLFIKKNGVVYDAVGAVVK